MNTNAHISFAPIFLIIVTQEVFFMTECLNQKPYQNPDRSNTHICEDYYQIVYTMDDRHTGSSTFDSGFVSPGIRRLITSSNGSLGCTFKAHNPIWVFSDTFIVFDMT